MFRHAHHSAPLAVQCPKRKCQQGVGRGCVTEDGRPFNGFHGPRRALVALLPDAVKDRIVEMVSTLQRMRRLAGGVESKAMEDVVAEIGQVVTSAKTSAGV